MVQGQLLGMALKLYASVAKVLTLKITKCWGLIPTIVEVTDKKLVGIGWGGGEGIGLFVPSVPFRIGITLNSNLRNTYTFAKHQTSKM